MAADAFRVELFDAIDGLTDTAKDWPKDEDGTRRYRLRHFPYTVMHQLPGRNVTVFAIAHPSRRQGYCRIADAQLFSRVPSADPQLARS